nr:hypothetical protein [Morchella crassipes]
MLFSSSILVYLSELARKAAIWSYCIWFYFATGLFLNKPHATTKKYTIYIKNQNLNPYFVTGFCDGESCFTVNLYNNPSLRTGLNVSLVFSIHLNIRDIELLEQIKAVPPSSPGPPFPSHFFFKKFKEKSFKRAMMGGDGISPHEYPPHQRWGGGVGGTPFLE